ncbi:MAG TPA: hypothetical protein VNI02_25925 [Blastocatellia bacterium]|jgi:hypothetical protein|nr:hypothetical protein [Blastocatellia bacterium]
MKNKLVTSLITVLMLLCAATVAFADIKVRTKTTLGGQSYEGTTYIKKSRQRTEQNFGGMSMATIMQCDLRRNIQVNDKGRTYLITPFDGGATAAGDGGADAAQPSAPKPAPARRGGVLTFIYDVTDTGERKQMFGMTARHLKVTMSSESSPDACNPSRMKMEMDGWYVDLQYGADCEWNTPGNVQAMRGKSDCVDEYRTRMTGAGKMGYPLLQTTTMFDDGGRETTKVTTEVVELSTVPLDASLFEIPAGYTEAKNAQHLYASSAMSQAREAAEADANDRASKASNKASGLPTGAASASIPGIVSASTPKKEGAVRIGVVIPKAQMSDGVPAAESAEAVRNTFAGFLNGPSVEVVALSARLPEQALEEARQGQCDYILFSSLTQKKGGGMFGKVMGNVAGAAGSVIPYGGSAGGVAARTAATTAIYTTAAIAGSIKAKDELTLEYRLQSTGADAKPVLSNTSKAKAKTDGEDVVTPLVEKAAQTIVGAVRK